MRVGVYARYLALSQCVCGFTNLVSPGSFLLHSGHICPNPTILTDKWSSTRIQARHFQGGPEFEAHRRRVKSTEFRVEIVGRN